MMDMTEENSAAKFKSQKQGSSQLRHKSGLTNCSRLYFQTLIFLLLDEVTTLKKNCKKALRKGPLKKLNILHIDRKEEIVN